MQFRTELIIEPRRPLDPERSVTLLGSCFSDNIGRRMLEAGWPACVNPCGTLFNPASIARILRLAISPRPSSLSESDLFLFDREAEFSYRCWDFPTKFRGATKEECLAACEEALATLRDALLSSQALIVTFGTAWVYELNGRIVANCHKMPASLFTRRRMAVEEIVTLWQEVTAELHAFNPDLHLIYTVSPVRHLKDGFADNARSKATLLLACEALTEKERGKREEGPGSSAHLDCGPTGGRTCPAEYFPAFELLNDDLRDYRFYADDLVHPSEMAADYIFGKFLDSHVDAAGRERLRLYARVHRREKHVDIASIQK